MEKLLINVRHEARLRKRNLYAVNLCLFIYAGLSVYWTAGHPETWPVVAKIGCVAVWIILFFVGMLMNLGGLSQGYRHAIAALADLDTDDPRVAEYLIDGLHYDWPTMRTCIIQAIGRLLPKLSEAVIIKLFSGDREKRLWWAVAYSSRSQQLTVEQAENVAQILKSLIRFGKSGTSRRLRWLANISNQKNQSEGQRYLRAIVTGKLVTI